MYGNVIRLLTLKRWHLYERYFTGVYSVFTDTELVQSVLAQVTRCSCLDAPVGWCITVYSGGQTQVPPCSSRRYNLQAFVARLC